MKDVSVFILIAFNVLVPERCWMQLCVHGDCSFGQLVGEVPNEEFGQVVREETVAFNQSVEVTVWCVKGIEAGQGGMRIVLVVS